MKKHLLLLALWLASSTICLQAQTTGYQPGEIKQALKKLNVLGSVLYLAAHPDDENTRLITYMANEKLMNTAYLSLTRGDGGQNLIGPEMRDLLGVIRTYELLAARDIDGGQQFFTRANDFGYSKTADETFNTWNKEQVLADVVWTIRKFRPDVIITRFPPEKYNYETHGHHSASAILAEEAFAAAGDPTKFPEQLKYVDVWQPKRLYWNTSTWFYKRTNTELDTTGKLMFDVGAYSPLLGKSYSEVASESRSQHRSQGFGTALARGEEIEYLEFVAGEPAKYDLFEGINTTWKKVTGTEALQKLFDQAYNEYRPEEPTAILPTLAKAHAMLQEMEQGYWRDKKLDELEDIILACSGLYLEATTNNMEVIPGGRVSIDLEVVNRLNAEVKLNDIRYFPITNGLEGYDTTLNYRLNTNEKLTLNTTKLLPELLSPSAPYWLAEWFLNAKTEQVQPIIGLPGENMPPVEVRLSLTINGMDINYTLPLQYKSVDPAVGEDYQPVAVVPPVLFQQPEQVIIFNDETPKTLSFVVQAQRDSLTAEIMLLAPGKEWQIMPTAQKVKIDRKGGVATVTFTITPPKAAFTGIMKLKATDLATGAEYDMAYYDLTYDHIPHQKVLSTASFKVVKLDIEKRGEHIGYIMGAGDEVPQALEAIGYKVTLLEDADINAEKLAKYDAVVVGVRAFNVRESLKYLNTELWKYAEAGGTVVVQYNTSHRLVTEEVSPLPLTLSRNRITDETAEMKFLAKKHPVLNTPNKITEADLNDWVQERGLYFPSEWDKSFTPIFSGADPGEDTLEGSLLVAPYGKGYYVYTGISWFRELPAGVPGAYRIFANLVSLGKK